MKHLVKFARLSQINKVISLHYTTLNEAHQHTRHEPSAIPSFSSTLFIETTSHACRTFLPRNAFIKGRRNNQIKAFIQMLWLLKLLADHWVQKQAVSWVNRKNVFNNSIQTHNGDREAAKMEAYSAPCDRPLFDRLSLVHWHCALTYSVFKWRNSLRGLVKGEILHFVWFAVENSTRFKFVLGDTQLAHFGWVRVNKNIL